MLSDADVVDYVKRKISFLPYFDLSDGDILDHCRRFALRRFSKFLRKVERTVIDTDKEKYQTEEKNKFKFFDKDNRDIINIVGLFRLSETTFGVEAGYFTTSTVYDINSLTDWLTYKFYKDTIFSFLGNESWEWLPPNQFRLFSPRNNLLGNDTENIIGVKYERRLTVPEIPPEHEDTFLELCAAYMKEWVANMRMDTVSTPFGEINLNSAELRSEAITYFDRFEETIKKAIPNIYIYVE